MTARSVFSGNSHFLAAAIIVSHIAAQQHSGEALMKTEGYIKRQSENHFALVIDKRAVVAIAVGYGRDSFTEIFGVRKLHGNNELSGSIDKAALAVLLHHEQSFRGRLLGQRELTAE